MDWFRALLVARTKIAVYAMASAHASNVLAGRLRDSGWTKMRSCGISPTASRAVGRGRRMM